MILIVPELKIPESFKWRARLSHQLGALLHSSFKRQSLRRHSECFYYLSTREYAGKGKTINQVVNGWFIWIWTDISTISISDYFFSFCHKLFFFLVLKYTYRVYKIRRKSYLKSVMIYTIIPWILFVLYTGLNSVLPWCTNHPNKQVSFL